MEPAKLSLSDFNKRKELFSEFIYWLFDSFVMHILRNNFYITETAIHRNRVYYFRHDIWREISTPSITKLKNSMLEEISKVFFLLTNLMTGRGKTYFVCVIEKIDGILFRTLFTKGKWREMYHEPAEESLQNGLSSNYYAYSRSLTEFEEDASRSISVQVSTRFSNPSLVFLISKGYFI